MNVVQDPQGLGKEYANVVVALGNFDGVHLGHQQLIKDTIREARRLNGTSVVMTFHPHPLQVLYPNKAPKLINTLDRRIELIREMGADVLLLLPFNRELAAMPAENFVKDILHRELQAQKVFVGFNFSFGHRGAGTPELLKSMGQELGFAVEVLPPIMVDGTVISSTEIRQALEQGDIMKASQFLGYWPILEGPVVAGFQRGSRKLGFPTANIGFDQDLMLPCRGVYAAKVKVREEWYDCVVNIGTTPTFSDQEIWSIEAHILNFDRDIYGEYIQIHLLQRLRDERKFNGVNELVEQIKLDIAQARALNCPNKWQILSRC